MPRWWKFVPLWALLLSAGCKDEGPGDGTGQNPCAQVVCTALDPCHVAGTCDPETGLCSNPRAPDGTSCTDGNACTQTDTCKDGACVGDNPVSCATPASCHMAGQCNPSTGQCPAAADGTACTLANASASCTAGSCGVTSCSPGFRDCDSVPTNGCETDLGSPSSCGACGNVCPGGERASCIAGRCASLACSTDDVSGLPASGWLPIPPSKDFVPLCSGEVLLGDTSRNQLLHMNVPRDTLLTAYGLEGKPGALALDADNGYLHAALTTGSVVRLELSTGAIATTPVSAEPLDITLGNGGQLFASLRRQDSYELQLAIIDGHGARVQQTISSDFGDLVAFDRQRGKLITGNHLITPSSLRRYAFDPKALTLTREQDLWGAGGNCQDLAVSPDGARLAHACGSGNSGGYTIADFSPADFTSIAGHWATDAYPRAAVFSQDSRLLVASNGARLLVFDAETHELLNTWLPVSCDYGAITRVGISRGGRIVFALTECGFDRDSGIIHWFVR